MALGIAFIGGSDRSIGTIVPDVIIEENHRDSLVITQHPVEGGAAITDHAFSTPSVVVIRAGFSNSSAGDPGYAREVYETFLAWREQRDLREVSTGKRLYPNMLPADITVQTDEATEEVLMVTVTCQEVLVVSTQTTGGDTAAPGTNQGDPASTDPVANSGGLSGVDQNGSSFAGAFNPGNTNVDGGTLGNGSFSNFGSNGYNSGGGLTPPDPGDGVATFTGDDGTVVTGPGQTVTTPFSAGSGAGIF